jgi:predicted DNA-binding transcriptional regulator AlpA
MVAMENLLTAAEVGEVLRLKARSVRAMSRSGTLPPAIRIGRRLRWRRSEIVAFVSRTSAMADGRYEACAGRCDIA